MSALPHRPLSDRRPRRRISIFGGVAVAALLGSLASCGNDGSSSSSPPPSTQRSATQPSSTPPPSAPAPTTQPPSTQPPSTQPPTTFPSAGLQATLDSLITAGVPGAVVLARHGDASVQLAAGVSDREAATPMTTDTRFRTGSVAKSFVATVALQLVAEGVLSLDEPVEQRLPGLVPGGADITLRHLLGNRSGIFDFANDPRALQFFLAGDLGHVWEPRQLVALATEHPANFAPGTDARYSNTDYVLAGLMIEAATSRSVSDEVRSRIIEPLRLDDTDVPTTAQLSTPYSHGYFVGDAGLQDVTAADPSLSSFGGNLVSTAGDLATFFDALFAGDLVPEPLLTEMMIATGSGEQLGLGLQVVQLPCGTFIGHSGSTPGYKAAAFNDLEHGRQFVVLFNSLTIDDQVGNPDASRISSELIEAAACT